MTVRTVLERTLSLILAGFVISLIIVIILIVASRGAQQEQRDADKRTEQLLAAVNANQETVAATNRALGCTLLLPSKPLPEEGPNAIGRDLKDGIKCWTDEGQEPPSLISERG